MTLQVIIFIPEAIEKNLTKILTLGIKILFHFVEHECPRQSLFNIDIAFAFSCLPEVQGKIFLKTSYTLDIGFWGLEQHLNWMPPFWWLAFILFEASAQHANRENNSFTSYDIVGLSSTWYSRLSSLPKGGLTTLWGVKRWWDMRRWRERDKWREGELGWWVK